ncbi:PREDICTED: MKRN2 opposite strand protein isoform X2 [Myotis davidii]|uniref:MKRN2 opposite strand protein isoform X2 n=1 Tax=Myotis davidii TaxID=225400 RepID=UPI0003EBF395|nr:PREDICTED: MKRN2 opposite strand protein isoform X2 [Myotis davidii]
MLTFWSSRTGLLAHSPLALGEGQQNRWGQGEILDLKCRIGLTSFETGLSLTWTLLAIWHQTCKEAHHSPTLSTNSLSQTSANAEKICVSFRDYDGRSDLHVGITNTNGVVYNYTMHGVQRDEAGWEQSVSVPLLQPGMFGLMDQWDKYLEDFSTTEAWLPHRYEEEHHNCYSYTLTFINCVLATEGKEQLDKNEFTEKFVVPRTRKASKYITLYRAVEEHGFYVIDHPHQEPSPPPGSGLC